MPIQYSEENGGKTLVIHVAGKLVKADYDQFVPEFTRLVAAHGKLRVFFDMTGLEGWDGEALWEEIKFDAKHFGEMERIAAVGDKKWEEVVTALCIPFTKATMRYFDHGEAAQARAWLDGEAPW